MQVEVLKSFAASSGQLQIGDVVDASEWRLTPQLIAQRYVREVRDPAPAGKGKRTKETTND